jgi:adenylate cyclase
VGYPSRVKAASLRKLRNALLPGGAAGLLAAALCLSHGGAVEQAELFSWDLRAARAAHDNPASPGVVLVAVDDATVRLGGGTYPVPRSAMAAIISEARRAGARTIAVDFILEDPLEGSLADENDALEEAIAGGRVILGAASPRDRRAEAGGAGPLDPATAETLRGQAVDAGGAARHPERFAVTPPLLRFARAAAALGCVTQEQESDGRVHALRHVYPTPEGDLFSLPLAAAWIALGRPPVRVEADGLRIGDRFAPALPDGRVVVRWTAPADARPDFDAVYPVVSAADLLASALAREGEGTAPPPAALAPLKDAVVVLSATVTAGKDKRPTPINPRAVGGEIVATAIDDVLQDRFVRRVGRGGDALAALALALAAALVVAAVGLARLRPAVTAAAAGGGVVLVAGGYGVAAQALASHGVWIAAAAPLAGALLAASGAILLTLMGEMRDRRFVHDALGRYTSPVLVQTLMERPDLLDRFGGARQEITVYFSDIRGFTTLSEGMEPERLVELLNEYLSAMTGIVERHGGYVDKYIGDAIMAIWGAPLPAPDHAARACRAAIEMRDRLAALRPEFQARFGVELHARAGVNTTAAVVGNVGSRQKTNYTALGDGVNLASRLEGANKAFGTAILCGDATRAAAGDAFAWRTVDLLRVKGKHAGVPVHELVGPAEALDAAARDRISGWEAAQALARRRAFGEARDAFAVLSAERPDDALAALWAERSAALAAAPPPADWDGVHELHEK